MNAKQALAEARRRFGKTASVKREFIKALTPHPKTGLTYCRCDGHPRDCGGFHWRCTVGRIELGMFFMVRGEGETFEIAFAHVDRVDAADRARYAPRLT